MYATLEQLLIPGAACHPTALTIPRTGSPWQSLTTLTQSAVPTSELHRAAGHGNVPVPASCVAAKEISASQLVSWHADSRATMRLQLAGHPDQGTRCVPHITSGASSALLSKLLTGRAMCGRIWCQACRPGYLPAQCFPSSFAAVRGRACRHAAPQACNRCMHARACVPCPLPCACWQPTRVRTHHQRSAATEWHVYTSMDVTDAHVARHQDFV